MQGLYQATLRCLKSKPALRSINRAAQLSYVTKAAISQGYIRPDNEKFNTLSFSEANPSIVPKPQSGRQTRSLPLQSNNPIFEYEFTSSTQEKYRMVPMTQDEVDYSAYLLASGFVSAEPLDKSAGVSLEMEHRVFKQFLERSVEEGLAAVVKNADNEIIAATYCLDQYNNDTNPLDFSWTPQNLTDIHEFIDSMTIDQYGIVPRHFRDVVIYDSFAINPKYGGQKIFSKAMKWMMLEHPIVSQARVLWGRATNPMTINLWHKFGAKTLYTIDPRPFVNSNGEQPFKNIDNCAKELGLRGFDGIDLVFMENRRSRFAS